MTDARRFDWIPVATIAAGLGMLLGAFLHLASAVNNGECYNGTHAEFFDRPPLRGKP